MSPTNHPFLFKVLPCFYETGETSTSPSHNHHSEPDTQTDLPPTYQKAFSKHPPPEPYVPTWQRVTVSGDGHHAPVTTGRRKPAAGDPTTRCRAKSEPESMLYFGDGSSSSNSRLKTPAPAPRLASNSHATSSKSGSAAGGASGRDASGYLNTGVGRNNIMNGSYSSITYGGSLQYGFAGTQV